MLQYVSITTWYGQAMAMDNKDTHRKQAMSSITKYHKLYLFINVC
jgi:hypothetical protein